MIRVTLLPPEQIAEGRCRHRQNSPETAVDNRGRVCHPNQLDREGCCKVRAGHPVTNASEPFSCAGCTAGRCCGSYERCVACCSAPTRADGLSKAIWARPASRLLLKRLETPQSQFDWCLLLCRTDSRSTQHQNKFRNPTQRHCFGVDKPALVLTQVK